MPVVVQKKKDLCLIHSPFTSTWELLQAFLPHRLGRTGNLKTLPRWLGPWASWALAWVRDLFGGSG